jgi:hypothetical protein
MKMDTVGGSSQALAAFYFYSLTSPSLTLLGVTDATGLLLFKWTPPWSQMQFPLTLGTTWNYASTPESTQVAPGVVIISYRNATYLVDAFGTLQLPQGNFSALRIKEVELYTTGMPPLYISTTKTITYTFVTKEGITATVSVDSTQENLATVIPSEGFTYTRAGRGTSVETAFLLTPGDFRLDQNYPNPFNPTTEIGYSISGASNVKLAVYDLFGREVAVLVNGRKEPGQYRARFDATGLSSGVYLYRLEAGGQQLTKRLAFIK